MASFSCSSISNTWRESRKLHRSPVSIMACFQSAIAAASPLVKYSTTVCLSVKVLLTLVGVVINMNVSQIIIVMFFSIHQKVV
ncbi:hypothetical protein BDL97_01G147800 [Sphagnum fallax]|nr:hypothetical protein BDL97_01G147800 [Sphagnum fallax]KAH8975288.1 hypothetical protein BDL97_01G147800 [Sphagnum fallax]KAH8975289.1 hypothetical protein BDL97_01G147800 [Sphagnum fallax]